MHTKKFVNPYKKLIILKRIPYWLYYPALSFISLIAVEGFFHFITKTNSIISAIAVTAELAIMPTFYIWASEHFQSAIREISPILWGDDKDFDEWLDLRTKRIFTFDSFWAKFMVAIMAGGAIVTTISIGLPFKDTLQNSFILIALTTLALVGSQGAYMLVDTGITLHEIVRRPIKKIPFYLFPPPELSGLQNSYLSTILITVLTYGLFVLGAWQSPFGLKSGVLAWLWIGGVFPPLYFLGSSFQFYILLKRIKIEQIKQINEKIQSIFNNIDGQITKEQADTIEKLMSIQNQIQNLREIPFSLESFFTFVITLILPTAQFFMNFFKP
jgi:hypothetical protein